MSNNFNTIYSMAKADPEELAKYLTDRYAKTIPEAFHNAEELKAASMLLSRLANEKTFLYSLLCYLKVMARTEKGKGKENKAEAELMAMRRDAVDIMLEAVKGQYDAVSRMITVYKMESDEKRMTGLM